MANIIHAADFHIGAKFEFLPAERRNDASALQVRALQALIAYASSSAADALLIAGDLFDAPDMRAQVSAVVFSVLAKCPCPVFIAPGNHDYYYAGSPYMQQPVPSNVYVFHEPTLTPVALADGKTIIWGAAFQDNKASIPLEAPLDPTKINIALVHGELGGSGGYNSISESDVMESGFDYIALGHNHRFSGVYRIGQTALSCPGCFSATSVSETGSKGYLSGTISEHEAALTLRASGALEFCDIAVPMSGISTDAMLAETLLQQLPTAPDSTCCIVRLTGTRMYEPNLTALSRSLRQTFFHAQVIDESAPVQDLFRYQKEDGLRGMVTRDFAARLEKSRDDEEACAKLTLALEYALAALDGRELD